jgi:hypothetical protein
LTGIALESTSQEIKTKVDSLENTDLTGIALEASVQDVLTAVGNIDVDFTPVLTAVGDVEDKVDISTNFARIASIESQKTN